MQKTTASLINGIFAAFGVTLELSRSLSHGAAWRAIVQLLFPYLYRHSVQSGCAVDGSKAISDVMSIISRNFQEVFSLLHIPVHLY